MSEQYVLSSSEIAAMAEVRRAHPLNPRSVRHGRSLGDAKGLTQIGAHLVRVEPGRETTVYHYHEDQEELVYILEGRARLEIAEETVEVGAGDFVGFPVGGPAHLMTNVSDRDLVYLMIGERRRRDVTVYPRLGQRMIKEDGQRRMEELLEGC